MGERNRATRPGENTVQCLIQSCASRWLPVLVRPFDCKPEYCGHDCMFMSVIARGDWANHDSATFLPNAVGPTPLSSMVPGDNNQGLRAVIPRPRGGQPRALVAAFR